LLRIGFDISQTGPGKAGCGQMADNLISRLVHIYPEDEFILYPLFGTAFCDPQSARLIPKMRSANVSYALETLDAVSTCEFWRNPPRSARTLLGSPDVVHANNFFCPRLKGTRVVYTIYDLSFLDSPEFCTPENVALCSRGLSAANQFADMVVAISDFSLDRFKAWFPDYPRERARVVHLGSRFEKHGPAEPVAGLVPGDFWLAVGSLEPRKNLRNLLKAYHRHIKAVPDSRPLVLAGGKGWLEDDLPDFIRNLGLTDSVRLLGYTSDPQLKWLYENCWAFCYPSFYEGFGLPVLEAMSLGSAVISSNATSLLEVGGDSVLYVDPSDVEQISNSLDKLGSQGELRRSLQQKSLQQAARFSWEKTAKEVHQIYCEAADLPKRTRVLVTLASASSPRDETANTALRELAEDLKARHPEMDVHVAGDVASRKEYLSSIEHTKPDVVLHGGPDDCPQSDSLKMTFWEGFVPGPTSIHAVDILQKLTSAFDHVFVRTEEARQSILAAVTGAHDKVSVLPARRESPPSDHVASIIHQAAEAKSRLVEPEEKSRSSMSLIGLLDRFYWLVKRRPWLKARLKGSALARLLISRYYRSE